MPRTKPNPVIDEIDSDIGGRVQRGISLPKFLDNRVNRILKVNPRFKKNRSLLVQLSLERTLREFEGSAAAK